MLAGIGCDIVKIKRIEKAMEKEGFRRILSQEEQQIFDTLSRQRQVEWLAGRFAAKEAVYKAVHKHCDCVLSQITIASDASGAPICSIEGLHVEVSISHEEEYAIAYAVAMKE